jgi:hypothetical protein
MLQCSVPSMLAMSPKGTQPPVTRDVASLAPARFLQIAFRSSAVPDDLFTRSLIRARGGWST